MNGQNHKDQADLGKLISLLNSGQQIDLRQYWATLCRRKWWIIVPCFLITGASVAYALLFIRPVYESSATIQILPSRLQRSVREVTPGVSNAVDFRELQKTILSTNNLKQLILRLELTKNEQARQAAQSLQAKTPWVSYDELLQRTLLKFLRENIAVTMNAGAQLFQITARHESPQIAFQMTKTVAEVFIDESKKSELRGIRGVMEFSNEQLAMYQSKVMEAEDKLRRFKERQAAQQAIPAALGVESIQAIRELQNASETAISDRERMLEQLHASLPNNVRGSLWDTVPELAEIKTQINAKMQAFKRTVATSGLQPNYELSFNNEINALRQEGQGRLAIALQSLSPALNQSLHGAALQYQLAQIDLYILRTRNTALSGVLSEFQARATMSSGDQIELRRLEEEIEQNRRVYRIFMEQSRGSQIEEALQNSDADFKYSLVEAATLPVFAVSGSKRQFVSLAFLLSLGVGAAFVFAIEYLDQSIKTVEQVEEFLRMPTWGIIPKIEMPFSAWHASLREANGRSGSIKNPDSHQTSSDRRPAPKSGTSWRAQA
ncbi:MAG: GumC family protein [bacterium]